MAGIVQARSERAHLHLEFHDARHFLGRPGLTARPVGRGRIFIAQSLYAFATALSVVFPTWVSITLIVLVQLNYVLTPRIPILHRF